MVVGKPDLGIREQLAVIDVMKSGWVGNGLIAKKFEREFCEALTDLYPVNNAVAVSSCTMGIMLALRSEGIGRHDEVITTPLTFAATVNAILATGAKPVFVDVDETGCIDPQQIEKAITPQTKAIIPVHLHGMPCGMGEIMRIALEHGLTVIEDAAHAFGGYFNSVPRGIITKGIGNEENNWLQVWEAEEIAKSEILSRVSQGSLQKLAEVASKNRGTEAARQLPKIYESLRAAGEAHEVAMLALREYLEPTSPSRLQQAIGDNLALPTMSHGSSSGLALGTIGHYGIFSFYPTKNITCGEGGMVIVNDKVKADYIRTMASQGLSAGAWDRYGSGPVKNYEVETEGYKGLMPDLNAAIGRVQLERWPELKEKRNQIWQIYEEAFGEKGPGHSQHIYSLRVQDRDTFRRKLYEKGIGTGIHYKSLSLEPAFKVYSKGNLARAELLGDETVSLPLSTTMTPKDALIVVDAVNEVLQ